MILLDHIWFIAVNETENLFYTSDNPIILYGHMGHQGLKSKGCEIIFSINPKLALIMCEREYYKGDLLKHKKFVLINKEYVKFCNYLEVVKAYRYIFSKDKDFTLVSRILEENPELRDTKRNRFLMGYNYIG